MFEGSMVALVTPMKNGKIDEEAFCQLIERQIAGGTSALIPCGTTGESATLTHEEHDRVIALTVKQVNKRVKVLAGAGSNATHEAIRLHCSAQKTGADGALHITPYYNKPNQEGLYRHYQAIAESSPLPIVLYNVPSRTGVNLLPATVARLTQIPSIVGLKEASGSLEQVKELIQKCPKDFNIISGEDAQTLDFYLLGGRGAISVTANVVPQDCARQWELFRSGQHDEARQLTQQLLPLHQAMFVDTNPIPVKAALAMMGLIQEEYRLPLVELEPSKKEKLSQALKSYGLIK